MMSFSHWWDYEIQLLNTFIGLSFLRTKNINFLGTDERICEVFALPIKMFNLGRIKQMKAAYLISIQLSYGSQANKTSKMF